MNACILISGAQDPKLIEIVVNSFVKSDGTVYSFNKGDTNEGIPYKGTFPGEILTNIKRGLDKVAAQPWGELRDITALAISNYLTEIDFGTSDFFEEVSQGLVSSEIGQTIGNYVSRALVPRLNDIGEQQIRIDRVDTDVSGNKVEEQEVLKVVPSIREGLYNIFANSTDMLLFKTKTRNSIIKELFVGTYGLITDNADLSIELSDHQQRLIDNLVSIAEDITGQNNYLNAVNKEYTLNSKQLLQEFKSINVVDGEDFNYDAYKKLLKFFDIYFSDNISENGGMFYSADAEERQRFFDYLLLKNFDTFIQSYMDDLITIQPGYENSFNPTINGSPKYSSNIQLNPEQNWDDSKIESIAEHTNKAVQLYLQTLEVTENIPLNPTNFSRAINWIRLTYKKEYQQIRNNPQKLRNLFAKAYVATKDSKRLDISIRDAIKVIYLEIFDNHSDSQSLYNLYRDNKYMKYNLYDMLLNQVNKTSPLNYLQTGYNSEEDSYEVKTLDSDAVSEKKTLFERSIMTDSQKQSLNSLIDTYRINFKTTSTESDSTIITNENGKVWAINMKFGSIILEAKFNDRQIDYFVTTEANSTPVALKDKDIVANILNSRVVRSFIEEVFSRKFDSNYWKILMQNNDKDLSGVMDLAINTLLNSYIYKNKVSKLIEDNASINQIKQAISSSLSGITLDPKITTKWFNNELKSLRPGGLFNGLGGLLAIARTNAAITGDNAKSQVKDINGNSLPKFGLSSAMNDDVFIIQNLSKALLYQDSNKTPFKSNVFYGTDILGESYIDLEVINKEGDVKSVAKMTSAELAYHSLVNRYLNNVGRSIFVQPTTYADKSRIWVKKINMLASFKFSDTSLSKYNSLSLSKLNAEQAYDIHKQSMNLAYEAYSNTIQSDYSKLFALVDSGGSLVTYSSALTKYTGYTFEQCLKHFNALNINTFELHNYLTLAQTLGIKINMAPEIHYQPKSVLNSEGKKVLKAGNTMFRFYKEMFSNQELYTKKMYIEKGLYAFKFQDDGVKLEVVDNNGATNLVLEKIAKDPQYADWYDEDVKEIIPFKVYNANGKELPRHKLSIDNVYDPDNFKIILNPIIERYFAIDNLISDNYNAILFGFNFGHKGQRGLEFNPKRIDWKDIRGYKEEESSRTTAEAKRGVIGGATIHTFLKNKLNGVPSSYKISVIEDISGYTLNTQGGENEATPHDGGIFMNPFIGKLEMNSLPEVSLSVIHRKPIAYFDMSQYGISGLLKCATFAFNNDYIRNAHGKINGKRLLRKMADIKWNDPRIDLSEQDYQGIYFQGSDFKFYSISYISKIGENLYNIDLEQVDKFGESTGVDTTMEGVTINSNYDLWEALGGENSMSISTATNKLIFSEASIDKVVDVMNNISFIKKGFNENTVEHTQEYYEQPLKYAQVAYLVNSSAIKNGAVNVNPSEMYYEDFDLPTTVENVSVNNITYFDMDIDFLGIQMNADHEVDKAHVSEMTQVISSMEQSGLTHEHAQDIYENIGEAIAHNLADYAGDIVNDSKARSRVYRLLGKQLVRTFANNAEDDDYGLAQTYIEYIKEELLSGKDFEEQILKIPFNDPNISGIFQTGFTNGINKDIIKRQFPGIAAVMAPSHDIITIYDTPEGIKKYNDIKESSSSEEEFLTKLDQLDRPAELNGKTDIGQVRLGDYIRITYPSGLVEEGWVERYNIGKMTLRKVLDLRGQEGVKVTILGSKGRNLRPQNAAFVINEQTWTLFDLDSSRLSFEIENMLNLAKSGKTWEERLQIMKTANPLAFDILVEEMEWLNTYYDNQDFSTALTKYMDNKDKNKSETLYNNILAFITQVVQRDLKQLQDKGLFHMPRKFRTTNAYVPAGNVQYSANEMMLGKVWAQQFMLNEGDKLSDINSAMFFANKLATTLETHLSDTYYDMYLTRSNGKHLHIVLDNSIVEDLSPVEVPLARGAEGELFRIENNEPTYKVSTGFKFYTQIDDNGESHEIVYIPAQELPQAIKNFEASKLFTSVQVNPTVKNIRRLSKAISKTKLVKQGVKIQIEETINILGKDREQNAEILANLGNTLQVEKTETLQNLSQQMYISFKQATNFIVARIPAQSMQSFMNMTIAGFVDSKTNIVYVPIDQLIYQGSDYDIDKAYILGASIDKNGIYSSWSNIFDFSTTRLFEISNELPIVSDYAPETELTTISINGVEVDTSSLNKVIRPYIDSNIAVEKETAFEVLVSLINEMNTKKATIGVGLDDDILNLIDSHFSTVISSKVRTSALKNKIYFNMWKSGKNLNNWVAQTTPISMGSARTSADASPSGQFSKQMSNNNPISRFVLQYQNSIGKDAIGIDATGVKIWSLILNYFHEGIKETSDSATVLTKFSAYKRSMASNGDIIRVDFPAYSDSGKVLPLVQKFTVPNINWEKVGTDKFKQDLERDSRKFNSIPEDVFVTISVLLSAATDNAKELILEKINAGPDLAGVYIYLLTTGIEFEDIANFMTTSAVTLVQNKAKRNLVLGQTKYNNLDSAIKYYLNEVPLTKFMSDKYANGVNSLFKSWVQSNEIVTEAKDLKTYLAGFTSVEELEPILNKLKSFYKKQTIKEVTKEARDEYEADLDEVDPSDFVIEEEEYQNNKVKKNSDLNIYLNRYFNEVYDRQIELDQLSNVDNFKINITTLGKVVESAKELNILGRFGSLNQGIRTKLVDKIKYELQIEKFVNGQIKKMTNMGISSILDDYSNKWEISPSEIFNFELFAINSEYRQDMISLYELVKDTYNILGIIDKVPHFSAMLDAYGADSNVLSEYIDIYKMGKGLAKKYVKTELLPQLLPRHMSTINGFLNEVMISKFLMTMTDTGIIVNAGDPLYSGKLLTTSSIDKELNFQDPDDIGTFKHIFENKFINQMKRKYPNNKFIQDLIWNSYKDSYGNRYEFYQLPLNLDTVDQESNKELFGVYLQHFNNIREDIFMANNDKVLTIKDMFYLYNLIVNSNKSGRSSLTKIFKDSLKGGEISNSIMFDYFRFLGKITDKSETINLKDYDERDLIARLIDSETVYMNMDKKWDVERGKFQYYENGRAVVLSTLNNAVKLPFTMSSYNSVDKLLNLKVRTKLLDLAKLNQLEIKLNCDE